MTTAHDALWISRDGELACIHHVPHPPAEASDAGTWRPLTPGEADELADEAPAFCWTCFLVEQREEQEAARGQ